MQKLTLTLVPAKQTPKTVMFSEPIDESDFLGTAKLGNVYVPKATLAAHGWKPGATIEDSPSIKVTIEG